MAYRNDALEHAAIRQIFANVAKITGNVSHIIFHNRKSPVYADLSSGTAHQHHPTTVSLAVYLTVIPGFVPH
jgi:hypothetical protein